MRNLPYKNIQVECVIAALYIRSFLKYQPFSLDVPDKTKHYKTCLYTELPNEYFLIDYLEAIFKAGTNDFDGKLQMDPDYKFDFIKNLYRYKKDLSKLDPLSLSNTVFLIEEKYFIRSNLRKVNTTPQNEHRVRMNCA